MRRRQNRDQCWEMHSSPSVDSGQFEVQCNVIVNGPLPSPALMANSATNEAEHDEPVIRMSDLALVQRCTTLPRNYRKLVQQRTTDENNGNNARSSPIYCVAPSFSGSHLPSNMQIHEVRITTHSFVYVPVCSTDFTFGFR